MCRRLRLEFGFPPSIPYAEIELSPVLIDPQAQTSCFGEDLRGLSRAPQRRGHDGCPDPIGRLGLELSPALRRKRVIGSAIKISVATCGAVANQIDQHHETRPETDASANVAMPL